MGLKHQGVQCRATACGQMGADMGPMAALQVGQMLITFWILAEPLRVQRQAGAGVQQVQAILFIDDISF